MQVSDFAALHSSALLQNHRVLRVAGQRYPTVLSALLPRRFTLCGAVVMLCGCFARRPEEGPSFEFRVSWGGTPTLLVKLDAYISFIGIAMGVKIYITYSDWINFRAEFYLRPMDLCFGVIKISDAVAKSGNAVRTNGPQPAEFAGGPYAIFDSKALSIDISGSVCVLGSCSSIIVQVSKTRLYFQQASTFLEEVVDRGGQHHELPNRAKDQDGHRHVMSNTIEGNLRTTPGYKILSEYVYRCRHRQNNSLL